MNQFKQVVKEYQDQVYSFSRHFLGSSEDAQDVTQKVLIKLWENFDKLDKSQMGGWIMRVTRNACIDLYRQKKTRNAVYETEATVSTLFGSSDDVADKVVEQSEMKEKIDAAIGELKDPQKTILILREIQGMSYDEISESLEIPLNTVKVYLHRGRRTLRQTLTRSLELA